MSLAVQNAHIPTGLLTINCSNILTGLHRIVKLKISAENFPKQKPQKQGIVAWTNKARKIFPFSKLLLLFIFLSLQLLLNLKVRYFLPNVGKGFLCLGRAAGHALLVCNSEYLQRWVSRKQVIAASVIKRFFLFSILCDGRMLKTDILISIGS